MVSDAHFPSFIIFMAVIMVLLGALYFIVGCGEGSNADQPLTDPTRQAERDSMVDQQIVARGVKTPAVIKAMRHVPRHQFVMDAYAREAYQDRPLPIGYDQTISQPYMVAIMTEAIELHPDDKVLEIGTGSGYQAAVLAEIVSQVFTIEIVEPLAKRSTEKLSELGYDNVKVRAGDGYQGWPEEAPFDAIILTAAPDHVPEPLLDQLAVGGRMILPIGKFLQDLVLIRRTEKGYERTKLFWVTFVPMTGQAEEGLSTPNGS